MIMSVGSLEEGPHRVKQGLMDVGAPTTALSDRKRSSYGLHRPFAQLFGADLFQPFLQPLLVACLAHHFSCLGLVEDAAEHEDRSIGPQSQGDCIAWPGVDTDATAF